MEYARTRQYPIHGSLQVRAAIADALLANVSAHLGREEVDAVLECGFDSTASAARSLHHMLDWNEWVGRRML